jgi:hypothetical protein
MSSVVEQTPQQDTNKGQQIAYTGCIALRYRATLPLDFFYNPLDVLVADLNRIIIALG